LKKDLIITFITQFSILLISLLIYRWFKISYGEQGFAEYSLFKRGSGYLTAFMLMGVGVALPRQIALDLGKQKKPMHYLLAAIVLLLIGVVIILISFLFFRNQIAHLLFGGVGYENLINPLLLLVLALLFQTIAYGYFRGFLRMKEANIYQFLNLGFLPGVCFFLSTSVENYFYYLAISSFIFFVIFLFYVRNEVIFSLKGVFPYVKKLFTYGIQRVPGDFALGSLFALPAIFVAHNEGVIQAGYVAFAVSLLSLVGQLFGPVGLVYLPKISGLLGGNNFEAIRKHTLNLLKISVILAVFGVIIFQLFSVEILSIYLGDVNSQLNSITKTMMYGSVFYVIYVTMRSVIDSYYEKSLNTVSVISSLIIFFIINWISNEIIIALNVSLLFLALITLYHIFNIIKFKFSK